MGTTLSELKSRLASYKTQEAAQNARVEQAQLQLNQIEAEIKTQFGDPNSMDAELTRVEAEIQTLTQQVQDGLRSVGA